MAMEMGPSNIHLVSEFLGEFLLDTEHPFHFSRSEFDYGLPLEGDVDTYAAYADSLPLSSQPAVLGLHSNAAIRYHTHRRCQTRKYTATCTD